MNSVMSSRFQPMPLGRKTEPFDHPDGRFELKWDGFRALAHIEGGTCAMIIRAYGHVSTERLVATPWKEFLAAALAAVKQQTPRLDLPL
jgi:ATP-dependent DNA ligase